MMYLAVAINEPDNKLSAAFINIFTLSKAHHVEIVFSDRWTLSARPGFVGLMQRQYNYYDWLMIPLPMITEERERVIRDWAKALSDSCPKYDYLGACSGFFGSKRNDPTKWFCGELCAKALEEDIPELETLKWATPEHVWKLVSNYAGDPTFDLL